MCLASFFLYGILGLFTLQPFYSQLIEFIIIFFIISYCKLYTKKFNSNIKLNLILLISFIFAFAFYFVFFVDIFDMQYHINPITFPISVFMFNIFNSIKIRSNNIVNYISSCSLFIYCFSGNIYVINKIMIELNSLSFNMFNNIVYVLIANTLLVFVSSLLISFLYKQTINKYTFLLSNIIEKKILYIVDRIV